MKQSATKIFIFVLVFVIGFVSGGYLFSHLQPRPILSIPDCSTNCLTTSEVKGLLISAGIQWAPELLPRIIKQTDTIIVIQSPEPSAKIDYLILPKRDIKDLGQLTASDRQYIDDTFAVIAELIQENNFQNYQVVTNGPQRQRLNYLHFHLLVND